MRALPTTDMKGTKSMARNTASAPIYNKVRLKAFFQVRLKNCFKSQVRNIKPAPVSNEWLKSGVCVHKSEMSCSHKSCEPMNVNNSIYSARLVFMFTRVVRKLLRAQNTKAGINRIMVTALFMLKKFLIISTIA